VLIPGTTSLHPLPPKLDLTLPYEATSAALNAADDRSSFDHHSIRLQAHSGRMDLVDILSAATTSASETDVVAWLESLPDEEVVAVVHLLGEPARTGAHRRLVQVLNELAGKVTKFALSSEKGGERGAADEACR
jgi:hypothetical protein